MNEKYRKTYLHSFSQAEMLAVIAFLLAIPLLGIAAWLASIPLMLFLLLCLFAPFFPQWGFFLPIISKSVTGSPAVALTFDDGPSPGSTPLLLNLLQHYNYKATFFVIGQQAEKFPDLIQEILAQGHTIGNHSWSHDSLLMLRSQRTLQEEIQKSQQLLLTHRIEPLVFRPPAGITNPRLKSVLLQEGLQAVTFSCRAFDGGNKKIENLAARLLQKIRPGHILLLHDIPPETEGKRRDLQKELVRLFATLQQKGYGVRPLEELIGTPVMKVCKEP